LDAVLTVVLLNFTLLVDFPALGDAALIDDLLFLLLVTVDHSSVALLLPQPDRAS